MASLFSPPLIRQSASLQSDPVDISSGTFDNSEKERHGLFESDPTGPPIPLDLVGIRSLGKEVTRVLPFRGCRGEPSAGRVGLFLGGLEDLVCFRGHLVGSRGVCRKAEDSMGWGRWLCKVRRRCDHQRHTGRIPWPGAASCDHVILYFPFV